MKIVFTDFEAIRFTFKIFASDEHLSFREKKRLSGKII